MICSFCDEEVTHPKIEKDKRHWQSGDARICETCVNRFLDEAAARHIDEIAEDGLGRAILSEIVREPLPPDVARCSFVLAIYCLSEAEQREQIDQLLTGLLGMAEQSDLEASVAAAQAVFRVEDEARADAAAEVAQGGRIAAPDFDITDDERTHRVLPAGPGAFVFEDEDKKGGHAERGYDDPFIGAVVDACSEAANRNVEHGDPNVVAIMSYGCPQCGATVPENSLCLNCGA